MQQVNYPYDQMLDVFIVFFAGLLVFMGCATVYEAVTPLQFMNSEVGLQTPEILEQPTLTCQEKLILAPPNPVQIPIEQTVSGVYNVATIPPSTQIPDCLCYWIINDREEPEWICQ